MSKVEFVEVRTTLPSRKGAVNLGRQLVNQRLAACVQIAVVHSVYRWKGKVEEAKEWLCAAKVSGKMFPAVARFILKRHPYEVPEVVAVPMTAFSPSYRGWLRDSLGKETVKR